MRASFRRVPDAAAEFVMRGTWLGSAREFFPAQLPRCRKADVVDVLESGANLRHPAGQLGRIPIVDALMKPDDSGVQEAVRRVGAPLEPACIAVAVKTFVGLGTNGLPLVERCERRVEVIEVPAGVPIAL